MEVLTLDVTFREISRDATVFEVTISGLTKFSVKTSLSFH